MTGTPKVYHWITNTLSPPECLLCGDRIASADGVDLCNGCRADLPRNPSSCSRCGIPLPDGGASLCGGCLRRPPPFCACVAPYRYGAPVDYLVSRLKFHGHLGAARLLGELLAEAAADRRVDCIVPVPLHPSRLRERGFNQALELARPVGRRLGLAVEARHVDRIVATAPQSRLDARERRRNLRGAFRTSWVEPPRRVAIVDDVLSTGSTVADLTRCLRQAGVRWVEVWVAARAVGRAGD